VAGPILYSTNCWFAHDVAIRYRAGRHFVWCSEWFDPSRAPPGSAAAAIAPSSSPKGIFDTLRGDCKGEDTHSALIKGYRRTFKRLAKQWLAANEITRPQLDEIVAAADSRSWNIWRPVLFVIPKTPVEERIVTVPHQRRAAYGHELQILDLMPHEFDLIEP
jgi:hypothetical protein